MVVGHVAPEAYEGRVIALVQEGDTIAIDSRTPHAPASRSRTTSSPAAGQRWRRPPPRYTRGVLAKFARSASSASTGAVLDAFE